MPDHAQDAAVSPQAGNMDVPDMPELRQGDDVLVREAEAREADDLRLVPTASEENQGVIYIALGNGPGRFTDIKSFGRGRVQRVNNFMAVDLEEKIDFQTLCYHSNRVEREDYNHVVWALLGDDIWQKAIMTYIAPQRMHLCLWEDI